MSVYSLTTASEKAIGMLLTAGGGSETLLLRRPANELRAELHIEPAASMLSAVVYVGHDRHSQSLQAGDGANAQHLADFIEAIANGTASTAETGAICKPSQPEAEPFALNAEDEASLRHLVRIGGTRHLQCGVSVTVHNARFTTTRRDAVVTTPGSTEHLHAGTPGELYVILAQHIEAALNAA